MAIRNIIVVGASAGGVAALRTLVALLPADLPAAIFITLHMSERSTSVLHSLLNAVTPLEVTEARADEEIVEGHVYVAPPGRHLILHERTIELGHGPKENLQRPCINVMFRSAAQAHGSSVVGVLLTGMLDDGAAGLWEIQKNGGVTIAQLPEEAAYASMPESAIRGGAAQRVLRLSEIGAALASLAGTEVAMAVETQQPSVKVVHVEQACPECGGVMRVTQKDRLLEYSCHVGHRFGPKTMIACKTETIERSLWNGVAQLEELVWLLKAEQAADPPAAAAISVELIQRQRQIESLKELLADVREAQLP